MRGDLPSSCLPVQELKLETLETECVGIAYFPASLLEISYGCPRRC